MKLRELVERYVACRQALGERFRTNAVILRAFTRSVGPDAEVGDVRPEQVSAFLAGAGPITSAWHVRHNALKGLYRYALSRGFATVAPLPAAVPRRPPPFVPYIYSREELRRLLLAAGRVDHALRRAAPHTLRAFLLTLYGAGLRVHEAIRLTRGDVDLASALATVRDSKFFKSRLVPLGPLLAQALAEYAAWRQTEHPAAESGAPFFVGRDGARLGRQSLTKAFRRVRDEAGIRRQDGARYQPRMHDLRHAFAVYRLTEWYRQGADVQRLLPQLSTYLGHSCLVSTQVYLSMTPELLAEASARFERYAEEASHD
jgi:site-specific recombinase XerD